MIWALSQSGPRNPGKGDPVTYNRTETRYSEYGTGDFPDVFTERSITMREIKLTNDNYEEEVTNAQVPVLIDFSAAWCGPCRALAPLVAEIAEEYDGRVKVCTVDIDEQPGLASSFGIMNVPTLVVMKNGKISRRSVGLVSRSRIRSMLG